MNSKQVNLVVLTGAGMSAESGISTFRDANGLWHQHDIMEVASIDGWKKNPALVHSFYNIRRKQLKEVLPNAGHLVLAELEKVLPVHIITQNVDDLHERAGSSSVLHLHGELKKVRSTGNPANIQEWEGDLEQGDLCTEGYQLRPHIVWFGESVPMLEQAILAITKATHVFIVGTSMQVYPAASLIHYAPLSAPVWYIDPNPAFSTELDGRTNLTTLAMPAGTGVAVAIEQLKESLSLNR